MRFSFNCSAIFDRIFMKQMKVNSNKCVFLFKTGMQILEGWLIEVDNWCCLLKADVIKRVSNLKQYKTMSDANMTSMLYTGLLFLSLLHSSNLFLLQFLACCFEE